MHRTSTINAMLVVIWCYLSLCYPTWADNGAQPPVAKLPAVVSEVEQFLAETMPTHKEGTEAYYATIALEEALKAFKSVS